MTWCKPMSKSHGIATARLCALCKHVMISHLSIIHTCTIIAKVLGEFNLCGVAILHVDFLLH